VWVDELPEHSPWREGQWALAEVTETQAHRLLPSPLPRGSVAIIGDLGSGRSATARALAALAPRAGRSAASTRVTSTPAARRYHAVVVPVTPAPMTITCISGIPYWAETFTLI
jgi:hypothetical protein